MKSWLTASFIDLLNRETQSGVFFKAVALTVAVGDVRYYADTDANITFNGNVYTAIPMIWEGQEQNAQMELPAVKVTVSNITGIPGTFLETSNLLGNTVVLRLLHLDLLATVTDVDSATMQIMLVEWTQERATFTLGINLGLQQQIPAHIITRAEFPGVPDAFRRATLL